MDYVIPLLVAAMAGGIVIAAGSSGLPNRSFLATMAAIGFMLRLILCVVFCALPALRLFHDDAGGYETFAIMQSLYWRNEGPYVDLGHPNNYGFYYWNAAICYVFGSYQLLPSLANSVASIASSLLIYRIALMGFVEPVAKRTYLLALFFPSMILWSSITCKDTLMVLLATVAIYATLNLRQKLSLRYIILAGVTLMAMFTVRFYMFYMAGLAMFLSLTIGGGKKMGKRLLNQALLGGAVVIAFMFLGLKQEAQDGLDQFDLQRVSAVRNGLARTAKSSWMEDADVSTPGKAIAFMPYGVLFLLFSPFPWQFTSLRPWLTLPEMLVWWPMAFSWFRGFRYVIARRKKEALPIAVFTLILVFAYSIVHGNAGIAFRQRSQVMIFLFLFASVGYYLKKYRMRGLPDSAIEKDGGELQASETEPPAPRRGSRYGSPFVRLSPGRTVLPPRVLPPRQPLRPPPGPPGPTLKSKA